MKKPLTQSVGRVSLSREPSIDPTGEDATDDDDDARGVDVVVLGTGAVHVARVEGVETRSSSWRTKRVGFQSGDVDDDDDSAATRRGSKNASVVVDYENDENDDDSFG